MKRHTRRRITLQTVTACLSNGYLRGFMDGKVFTGPTKGVCVPWLNCYSCPGAIASCPVGSLQTVLGGRSHGISFYVMGALVLFGVVLGRLVCGFLCPFGFIQDLLQTCSSCSHCKGVCPMGLDPSNDINGPECIRCGNCKAACPTSSIVAGFELRAREALKQ